MFLSPFFLQKLLKVHINVVVHSGKNILLFFLNIDFLMKLLRLFWGMVCICVASPLLLVNICKLSETKIELVLTRKLFFSFPSKKNFTFFKALMRKLLFFSFLMVIYHFQNILL